MQILLGYEEALWPKKHASQILTHELQILVLSYKIYKLYSKLYNYYCKAIAIILSDYTQYPIIRNDLIRNSAKFLGKFKKRALGRSNLRNASKNLRNGQCSDF